MPGSQTELALITADFVKVYDLGKDVLSPQYYFLVPSGKISDCTLAFMADGLRYVLIMSAAGHIHFQVISILGLKISWTYWISGKSENWWFFPRNSRFFKYLCCKFFIFDIFFRNWIIFNFRLKGGFLFPASGVISQSLRNGWKFIFAYLVKKVIGRGPDIFLLHKQNRLCSKKTYFSCSGLISEPILIKIEKIFWSRSKIEIPRADQS